MLQPPSTTRLATPLLCVPIQTVVRLSATRQVGAGGALSTTMNVVEAVLETLPARSVAR